MSKLRSYSLRFRYRKKILCRITTKYYYDFYVDGMLEDLNLNKPSVSIGEVFEYSHTAEDSSRGYNFHLSKDGLNCVEVLKIIPKYGWNKYLQLKKILGNKFLNHTFGVRNDENGDIEYIFYFYPTMVVNRKKKMIGLLESDIRCQLYRNLCFELFQFPLSQYYEFYEFIKLGVELKGIGIWMNTGELGYSIYLKGSNREMGDFFSKKGLVNIDRNGILFSIKISNRKICGYNIYYSGEYGLPNNGWGEVIM